MEWNEYFKNLTNQVRLKSKDINTKIGVVIVGGDNEIISTGYNSFPRGLDDDLPERQERPEKYYWFEHAERNAIYNAARIGVSTKGATMYMSCSMSCPDCARAIIQSGIKTIYVTDDGDNAKGNNWEDKYKVSLQMFKECGVEVRKY